jgi:hypothetical protein
MSENTPPTFDFLDEYPNEIRSMIFGYMIQNTIESQIELPDYGLPHMYRNEFHTLGFSAYGAKEHLTSSPWITLNKQYCAECLQVFVREVELRIRFTDRRARRPARNPGRHRANEPKESLQPIAHRFGIAGPHAGIKTSGKTLLSRLRGICFTHCYQGSVFEHERRHTERLRYPDKDFLTRPLRLLKQYNKDYDIPSDRLSVHINYGGPAWKVMEGLRELDSTRQPFVGLGPVQAQILGPVQAQIYVNDYEASVTAIDSKLEVMRQAVAKIIGKLHIVFPVGHPPLVDELDSMINIDIALLRRRHLEAIHEVTEFWKAPNGRHGVDGTFEIPERWTRE